MLLNVDVSVLDPDPNWFRIQQLFVSGSTQVRKEQIRGKMCKIVVKIHYLLGRLTKISYYQIFSFKRCVFKEFCFLKNYF